MRLGAPGPEPRARRRLTLGLALLSTMSGVAYIVWRTGWTLPAHPGFMAWVILVFEALPVLALVRRTLLYWNIDPPRAIPDPVSVTGQRVAVLIPTYNEPTEVLLPTITAAVALRPVHETWVLDDKCRPEVAALARRLGARYMARTNNLHAKAGNINHALGFDDSGCGPWCRAGHIDADIVAILDCDHVPLPGFLANTLGYFDDDPTIAIVQTTQSFYNEGSFEHQNTARFSEQELFFQVIQRAKDRRGAAFWCGTGALLRVASLEAIGGVATGTVTEDLHTSLVLLRHGFRTIYHGEVLTTGLAPQAVDQYLVQRRRWGLGSFQVLVKERIWRAPYLTWRQRLEYLTSILWWTEGVTLLGYFAVPIATAILAPIVVDVSFGTWLVPFVAVVWLRLVASAALSRDRVSPVNAMVLQVTRAAASLSATRWLFTRSEEMFQVTPKGRRDGDRGPRRIPGVVDLLLVSCYVGVAFVVARIMGVVPWGQNDPTTIIAAAATVMLLTGIASGAIAQITSEQAGADRRSSYRTGIRVPVSVSTDSGVVLAGTTVDLTVLGTGVRLRQKGVLPDTTPVVIVLEPPSGWPIVVRGTVTRAFKQPVRGERRTNVTYAGIRFDPDQTEAERAIALLVFHGEGLAPREPPAPPAAVTPRAPALTATSR